MQLLGLGLPHEFHAFGGADGAHVQVAAGVFQYGQVALQLQHFGHGGQALQAEARAHGALVHLAATAQVRVVGEHHYGACPWW